MKVLRKSMDGKTTLEERTEIVAFCIQYGKDHGFTAEKYGVSYQQVYSWGISTTRKVPYMA